MNLFFKALARSHSLAFDRLALFVIHLSKAGKRRGTNGTENPTQWANEFVSNYLWTDGTWGRDKLEKAHMDAFFKTVLDAQNEVRVKCRTNYRYLFEMCQYLPASNSVIDSGAEDWIMEHAYVADPPVGNSLSMKMWGDDSQFFSRLLVPLTRGNYQDWTEHCINRFKRKFPYKPG